MPIFLQDSHIIINKWWAFIWRIQSDFFHRFKIIVFKFIGSLRWVDRMMGKSISEDENFFDCICPTDIAGNVSIECKAWLIFCVKLCPHLATCHIESKNNSGSGSSVTASVINGLQKSFSCLLNCDDACESWRILNLVVFKKRRINSSVIQSASNKSKTHISIESASNGSLFRFGKSF